MRLTDIALQAFNGAASRIRRDAIVYALCAVCGIAAVVLAASASVLALEPRFDAVYARLIVAGGFVLIAAVALVWLRLSRSRKQPAIPLVSRSDATQRGAHFAQFAMVVEAALLGYSLARRGDRR